ncbi:PAS domain-containing protein [Actinoplanes sp. TFC3]|uniref:PAS domain-containing protein n=1 Tax=Actinoplanes sp. TFC3 TaxID=1710355 RepID=UPI001F2F01CE|nr:PAS domain-containing protein [Actinoplanes sp. TFC3]
MERTFDDGRLIVSKTDRKGIIRYVNPLFLEISAFAEEEVIGKPHNLIRHPAMPRAIFQLLWDRINAGKELFAYVINLAGDGAHYWVLAHVTPSFDRNGEIVGYHSNRRTADRAAILQIERLYAELTAEEARHSRPAEAIEASTALLQQRLSDRGQSYDQFVWFLATTTSGAS